MLGALSPVPPKLGGLGGRQDIATNNAYVVRRTDMEPKSHQEYVVGVMTMDVEGKDSERFLGCVTQAVGSFEGALKESLGVRVMMLSFEGPHLTPTAGAYAPLDFLHVGMTEKIERGVHFLLIITEVDLSTTSFGSTLALPSQLTNVGIISTKRLNPTFWGNPEDRSLTIRRLETLLLRTFNSYQTRLLAHYPSLGELPCLRSKFDG